MEQKKKFIFRKEWKWAYLFIAPMVLGTLIFGIIPIFFSIGLSLANWDGLGEITFAGLDNFKKIFTDDKLQYEIRNTLVYTFTTVPITLLLSLGVSSLLNKGLKLTGMFRVIYFLPNVVMPVAVAMVWRWLLNSKVGIVNIFLKAIGLPAPNWISDPDFILPSLIMISVWSGIGYNAIILLAGLQGISPELYEAAAIDGAGRLRRIWHITLTCIRPTIVLVATLNIANIFNAGFDQIFNLYSPVVYASGDVIDTYVYRAGFVSAQYSLATAVGLMKSIVSFLLIIVSYKLADRFAGYRIF